MLIWDGGVGRSFSVKALYNALLIHSGATFPVEAIWGKEVPRPVSFFA